MERGQGRRMSGPDRDEMKSNPVPWLFYLLLIPTIFIILSFVF